MANAKPRPKAKAKRAPRRIAKPISQRGPSHGGIGSDAVKKSTGKGWEEWCRVIDKSGGAKMTHAEIAEMLHVKFKVKPWWTQMVTVGYEQARGRREKHQKVGGYEISASKTLPVSATVAYMWWAIEKCRVKWLADTDVKIHKKTPSKSLRVTWNASSEKPSKSIAVGLYPKGNDKTAMAIQHGKLASAAEAKKMKAYWAKRLNRLAGLIDSE